MVASRSRRFAIEKGGNFCLKIGARRKRSVLYRKICKKYRRRLRRRLRRRAPPEGHPRRRASAAEGSPGHERGVGGERWGVLRQTQGRRTWASLGEAVFRQILRGGALRATILQRGRSQFPYPLKGGRQQSLRTVLGGGPSGPPPLLTSTSLGCRSQCRCGTRGELSTGGILGGLFGGATRWPRPAGRHARMPRPKMPGHVACMRMRPFQKHRGHERSKSRAFDKM